MLLERNISPGQIISSYKGFFFPQFRLTGNCPLKTNNQTDKTVSGNNNNNFI